MEAVDLSTYKSEVNKDQIEFDYLTPEQKEQLAAMAEEKGTEATPDRVAKTAFLVIVNHDDTVQVTDDLELSLVLSAPPAQHHIEAACNTILSDLQALKSARMTQQLLMQAGAAMAQAQEQQRLQEMLARDPKFRAR